MDGFDIYQFVVLNACISLPDADFDKGRLIKEPDHYPLDLADLVRFAKRLDATG